MAIGYGVACPKGKTRKQQKAKKDREDDKQLKAFRDAVWAREESKILGICYESHVLALMAPCQHCHAMVRRFADTPLTGEVHHRVSRRHKAARYDPDNGVLLCNFLVNGCHEKAERGEIEV